jgi:hypothetical protein
MSLGNINCRGSVILLMGFLVTGTSCFRLAPSGPIVTQRRIGGAFVCPFSHGLSTEKSANIQRSLTCLHQPVSFGREAASRRTGIVHTLPKRFFKTGSFASNKFVVLHANESPDSSSSYLQDQVEAIIESAEWRAGQPIRHNEKAPFIMESPYQVCKEQNRRYPESIFFGVCAKDLQQFGCIHISPPRDGEHH